MKVRFHTWNATDYYPPDKNDPWPDDCTLHKEHVEVPDNPTDRDLIVAYELLLCSDWNNPDDIPDDRSPAIESSEDGRLFWSYSEGIWFALWVEFIKEE